MRKKGLLQESSKAGYGPHPKSDRKRGVEDVQQMQGVDGQWSGPGEMY